MFLLEIVKQYPYLFCSLVGLVAYFFIAPKIALDFLKQEILKLMLAAEKAARKEVQVRGPELMSRVVVLVFELVVPKLPWWMQPLIREAWVRRLAQSLHDGTKDLLDDGRLNNSC